MEPSDTSVPVERLKVGELAKRTRLSVRTLQRVQERWAHLAARAKEAMDAGDEPASARVQALAREWRELTEETVQGFTGGDAAIEASVARMWKEEPDMGSQWGLGPAVREYVGRAMATLGDAEETADDSTK